MTRLKNAGKRRSSDVDILLVICDCFYQSSTAKVSHRFIADQTGLSVRTVTRRVPLLERDGHLAVRTRGSFKDHLTNTYAIIFAPEDLGKDAAKMSITHPVASDTLVDTYMSTDRWTPICPPVVDTHVSTNTTSSPELREGEEVVGPAGGGGAGARPPPPPPPRVPIEPRDR
jgi:hypothetical protein